MRTDELKKSYEKFGALYPVLVDKNGNVIDGKHRRRVDPNWPSMKIAVEDDAQKEIIAFIANINRREICGEEIGKRLAKIKKLTGWTATKIAEEIGRTEQWVLKYLPQKLKDPIKVKAGRKAAKQRLANSSLNAPIPNFAENVWFNENSRENFGNGYFHGNTDPLIVKECLLKYTKPDSIVLDPMAGSGTVLDVCKELDRENLSFDIRPVRSDIKFGDATCLELPDNSVDFIFAHFPYWNKVKYSDHPKDLSRLKWPIFLQRCENVMSEFHRILRPNGYFALLIGDHRHNGKLIDVTAHLSLLGQEYFTLFDKIIYLTRGQKSRARHDKTVATWRAKKGNYHLIAADFLLIFRKEA
jgi:DNA modification methylase